MFVGAEDEYIHKWTRITKNQYELLLSAVDTYQIPLLIECDGSRGRPIKAPAEHEPDIPNGLTDVVVVVGLNGCNQPLVENIVHRPEIFSRLVKLKPGELVSEEHLINYLSNEQGGLKNLPNNTRKILIINQADTQDQVQIGQRLSKKLLGIYDSCLITCLLDIVEAELQVYEVFEPLAAVILASGESSRMQGKIKQLLDWNGISLIRHVTQQALGAEVQKVGVVLGSHIHEIQRAIDDLPIEILENPRYQTGQSAGMRVAINTYKNTYFNICFLLCDQPFVTSQLINSLICLHRKTLADIVAPRIDGSRGNPVVFDHRTFNDLLQIHGDQGGRELFNTHDVAWLDIPVKRILIDIDTEKVYQIDLNAQ